MRNKIILPPKDLCSGCSACEKICPMGAIEMTKDFKGFYYPKITYSKCVSCGKCINVCDFSSRNTKKISYLKTFCVVNNNPKDRESSTSGGVFPIVARYTLKQGGVVFACRISSKNTVEHHFFDSIEELVEYKKSKYVQSYLSNTFLKCKEFLDNVVANYYITRKEYK